MSAVKLTSGTVNDRLQHWSQIKPGSRAMLITNDISEGFVDLTRQDFFAFASRYAGILRKKGVEPGNVVCNTLTKSPERLLTDMGILLAGAAVLSGVNFLKDKMNFLGSLRRTGCVAVVMKPDQQMNIKKNLENVGKVVVTPEDDILVNCPSTPKLKHILSVKCETGDDGHSVLLKELEKEESHVVDVKPSDLAYILPILGQTGFSTLVPRTHGSIVELGRALSSVQSGLDKDTFFIISSFESAEEVPLVYIACGDPTVSLCISTTHPKLFPNIGGYRSAENITVAVVHPDNVPIIEDRVRQLSLEGGCKSPKEHHLTPLQNEANSVVVAFMSAEGGVLTSLTMKAGTRHTFQKGDIGLPVQGVELKIMDNKQKEILDDGDIGDIVVRGPTVFTGYLCREKWDNRECFTQDGFFNTTYCGFWDDQHHLQFIREPTSVTIPTEHCRVFPGWWEVRLETCPGVHKVVVVSVPRAQDLIYEELCACVLRQEGSSNVTEERLRRFCQALALQSDQTELVRVIPKYFLVFDSFPVAPAGQSFHQYLRSRALRQLSGLAPQQ